MKILIIELVVLTAVLLAPMELTKSTWTYYDYPILGGGVIAPYYLCEDGIVRRTK